MKAALNRPPKSSSNRKLISLVLCALTCFLIFVILSGVAPHTSRFGDAGVPDDGVRAAPPADGSEPVAPPVAAHPLETDTSVYIKEGDIDWAVYPRPPPDNSYAVVHQLPGGVQRIVADVEGHLIALVTGVHLWASLPFPERIPQNLTAMQNERFDPEDILFHYAVPTRAHPFVVLGEKPILLYFPRILEDAECDHMIETARPELSRSLVTPHKGSDTKQVSEVRTSRQAWLDDSKTTMVHAIAEKLKKVVGIPQSEPTQVLRYEYKQQYLAHHDFFDPLIYGAQRTNRAATFFLYLNTLPPMIGGDTFFPRAFGRPNLGEYANCSAGVRVFPRKGSGVLFYDHLANGKSDAHTLHGSCAIEDKSVVKWGGTKWFRVDTTKWGVSPNAHGFE